MLLLRAQALLAARHSELGAAQARVRGLEGQLGQRRAEEVGGHARCSARVACSDPLVMGTAFVAWKGSAGVIHRYIAVLHKAL